MSLVLQICPLTAAGLELPAVALILPAPNFSFCRLPNYNMYFSRSNREWKTIGYYSTMAYSPGYGKIASLYYNWFFQRKHIFRQSLKTTQLIRNIHIKAVLSYYNCMLLGCAYIAKSPCFILNLTAKVFKKTWFTIFFFFLQF